MNGISLPTAPFLGLSALTGDISDNHEYVIPLVLPYDVLTMRLPYSSVIAITTYSAILSSPDAPRDKFRNNQSASGGSWFGTILKWLGFFGLVGALLFAYQKYKLGKGVGGARFAGAGFGNSGGFGSGGLGAFDSKRF